MARGIYSASADFDWAQLRQLAGNDSDFENELLSMFLEDARAKLRTLERAIADQHPQAVEDAAHSLRGASANVGASSLASVALQLEQNARNGNLDNASRLVQQLSHQCLGLQAQMSHRGQN